jgi:transposase
MAVGRTSRVMIEQIRELRSQGLSVRKISLALKVCRKTIRRHLEDEGVQLPEGPLWARGLDWERINKAAATGVPIKVLAAEFAPSEINYRIFWGECRRRNPVQQEPTIRMHHLAGERVQVDFSDGITIYDRTTGLPHFKTQLFVGVLPFSSYVFGLFVRDQKKETFIECHEQMWRSFGGVTKYVTPDNLKSGIKRAHTYDPEINPTFCDYANHMGFVVLPARPMRPQDKGSVERAIGIIQENFYQIHRDRKFYSLDELNAVFASYLLGLNRAEMKDYGVSRMDRFNEEKDHLSPINQEKYERADWKEAKVHADCHVQVARCFYSCPHQHIGQRLRVRLTTRMIEIFSLDGELVASHVRFGENERGKYSTNDAHYPPEKVGVARFEVVFAKAAAKRIGPKTSELVDELLSGERPLRYLRRVQAIIRIGGGGTVSTPAIEYACTKAIQFKRSRVEFIKDCAVQYDRTGATPRLMEAAPVRDPNQIYVQITTNHE